MTVNRGPEDQHPAASDPAWWEAWRESRAASQPLTPREEAMNAVAKARFGVSYVKHAPESGDTLLTMDEDWMKRLLFVAYRRPDAVACR